MVRKKSFFKGNSFKGNSFKGNTDRMAWVVAADMGYGHQRAAYPLKDIAYERIINANSDKIIAGVEKKSWNKAKIFYEWISRTSELPVIGKFLFSLYNQIQRIAPYYPLRNNSSSTFAVRYLERAIRKGLCKSLINYIKEKNIPLITTFIYLQLLQIIISFQVFTVLLQIQT